MREAPPAPHETCLLVPGPGSQVFRGELPMNLEPRVQIAARRQGPSRIRSGVVFVSILGALLLLAWPKGPVSAGPIDHADADGDGLCDAQEQVRS